VNGAAAGPRKSASKPRPRTGDKRKANQPLKIDKLPVEVRDAVLYLRNQGLKTWMEIEELSALKYEPKWKGTLGGFVDWNSLPLHLLELFPDMRLPHTSIHRWYDLRFDQVRREVTQRSDAARKIAEAFAASAVDNADEAVINAARDTLMSILAEDGSSDSRIVATKGLLKLSEVMSKARTNEIRERIVSVDERRVAQLEKDAELRRKRMEVETETVAKKMTRGELTLEDINKLRRNTFGLPPLPSEPAAAARAV